ncbi:MAG: hypothetical protein ACJ72N_08430 [Labedaea sp.]
MAKSPWEPDGTQSPPPPPVWDDPVSGLVTGTGYEQEPLHIDLAAPIEPDMSEVRRAVDAALAGEAQFDTLPVPTQRGRPPFPPGQPPGQLSGRPSAPMPGLVPGNPRAGWPRNPATRQLPGLRPRPPRPPARIQKVRRRGGTTGAAGMVAVLLVIGVLVLIVLTIIGSLLNTLTQLFN